MAETQAGNEKRGAHQEIGETALRHSLNAVHRVTDRQLAELILREGPALDRGEEALWAHALAREDDSWLLSGPDRASLRYGVLLGYRDRLVSLERLLVDIGHRLRPRLHEAYTEAWHRRAITDMVLDIGL